MSLKEYLQKQVDERNVILSAYDEKKLAVEELESKLAEAKAELESVGDLSSVIAERDQILAYIDELEPKAEEPAEEVVAEEPVAEQPVDNYIY